jgi:hypothetical protein
MRVIVASAITLAIIALLAMPPAGALFDVGFMGGPVSVGIPYVMGPDFTFAAPFAQSSVFMQAFNTSTLAHDGTGALAVAFPSIGGPGISPAIAQATSEDIVATRAYFFNDIVNVA